MKDYYHRLGIKKDATHEEIKSNYRRLALIWHPDKNKSQNAKHKFRRISEAYSVLSNPEKRKQYDEGLIDESNREKMSYEDAEIMFNELMNEFEKEFTFVMPMFPNFDPMMFMKMPEQLHDANTQVYMNSISSITTNGKSMTKKHEIFNINGMKKEHKMITVHENNKVKKLIPRDKQKAIKN
jgi:DnaJ-class molecular chaperone